MSSTKVYLRYVVLNFIEQNEVEVAPSSWLERIDGVLFCFWPNSNVGTKVIKCAIPDKHLWTKYAVRVFSDTDNYNIARYRAQKALETSHVEDSDENSARKILPPRRFREEEPRINKSKKTQQTKRFLEDSESSQDEISNLRAKKVNKRPRSTATASMSGEPDEDEEQPVKRKNKSVILPAAPCFPSLSTPQQQPHQSKVSANCQKQGSSIDSHSPRDVSSLSTPEQQPHQTISANWQNQGSVINPQSLRDDIYKLFESLERRIMLKLDQIQTSITSAVDIMTQSISQPSTSVSDLTEVLEQPCKSVEDLEDLCNKLKDAEFRKKMIRYLCLQSGGSLGNGIRRMLKKIGENSLWGLYSYKGRKGKLKFQDLLINDVIIRACSKAYPQQKTQSVEDMIAVTLKHAPDREKTVHQVRSRREELSEENESE
ncbi:uncharacterized protein [Misgurnus anguillicaudatus]|uniref:uncharacterized protein n=1 Tax=Misgurnus anguillicaudatus TaxID=75329 RepID=UPI003CCFC2B6